MILQYGDNGSAYAEWERINNAIDVNMANLHNYPGVNTQVIADAIKELAKNISIPEESGLAGIPMSHKEFKQQIEEKKDPDGWIRWDNLKVVDIIDNGCAILPTRVHSGLKRYVSYYKREDELLKCINRHDLMHMRFFGKKSWRELCEAIDRIKKDGGIYK